MSRGVIRLDPQTPTLMTRSIHDEDLPGSLIAASQSSEDSTEIGSPSSAHSSQLPSDLPAKPLSVIEEKKKHGFYPISWRVIGGGVMVSGKRMFNFLNG